MTLENIKEGIKDDERTLYDLVGVESLLTNIESQDLYVKSGIALVITNKRYLKEEKINTPKVLYLTGKEIIEEDFDYEDEIEDLRAEGLHLFLDIDKTKPFGIITDIIADTQIHSAGMGIENAAVLTFYSDVNSKKYPDIWKEWSSVQGNQMRYYIYEVWIKKFIYEIQKQVNTDMMIEMITEKVQMLKKNNYSKDSYMYRDTQLNLDQLLNAYFVNHNITRASLIHRFGDIASEESMSWLKDRKICIEFNEMVDRTNDYLDEEREPIRDDEKWFDYFSDKFSYTDYSSKEISRRFNKYYEKGEK